MVMKKQTILTTLIAALSLTAIKAQTISTVIGNGTGTYAGDGGSATSASIRYPYHMVIDGAGNMLLADWGNNRIRKITPAGIITTIAGTGVSTYGGDGGPATAAYLNQPADIAIDASGNILFSDNGNKRIRKIDASGTITTVVGTGSPGSSGDGGAATAATINDPRGIHIDAAGNLFIAEASNHIIRKVNAAGVISTVAGNRTGGSGGDGSAATAAQLNNPQDIAFDAAGNMYISDYNNHKIRMVTTSGTIATYAGTGTSGYTGDGGPANVARIKYPAGLYIDAADNMYIADNGNGVIRKIKKSGTISTVAGNGSFGYTGDGMPATAAMLNSPNSIVKDASGNLYITDELNNRIRKVTPTPLTISGGSSICEGNTVSLTSSEPDGTWSSSSTAIAAVGTSGTVTGVAAGTAIITYTESLVNATQTITVTPMPAAITGGGSVCIGGTATLANTVAGGAWSSSDISLASIDASGIVTGIAAGAVTITYNINGCMVTTSVSVISCPTGVNPLSVITAGINVYPNPATENFTVDAGVRDAAISILDMTGRSLTPSMSFDGTGKYTISGLPRGNYIIKVSAGGQSYRSKVVITD